MSPYFTAFCIALELLILIYSIRKIGFTPFPHATMIYIILAQAVLYAVAIDSIHYSMLDIYSSYSFKNNGDNTTTLFLCIFLFYFLLTVGIKGSKTSLSMTLPVISDSAVYAMCAVLIIHTTTSILSIDWNTAQYSPTYLYMASVNGLEQQNNLTKLVQQTRGLASIIAFAIAAYCFTRKKYYQLILCAPTCAWSLSFDFAAHSRYAAAGLGVFTVISLSMSRSKLSKALAVASGAFAGFAWLAALQGRGSGHHGFSSIGPSILTAFDFSRSRIGNIIANPFERIFVTSEATLHPRDFAIPYKFLSFSPLPSALDSFDLINRQFQIRLHAYVPMSAIGEVINFGPIYAPAFFTVQAIAGRVSISALRKSPTPMNLLVNSIVLLATYLQFTYPTRNMFRFFVVALILSFSSQWYASKPQTGIQGSPRRGKLNTNRQLSYGNETKQL